MVGSGRDSRGASEVGGRAFDDLAKPLFLPDATRAAVRSLAPSMVLATGHRALLCSAAHIMVTPGASVIRAAGGVRPFMNWPGVVVSDSGGFQIFSLSRSGNPLAKIDDSGMRFRFSTKQRYRQLTPESSIETQFAMGADVLYCLDYCTSPSAPRDSQERSVKLTIEWAKRSRKAFDELAHPLPPDERPQLFAVVQGGSHPDLRRHCADALVDLGFDGYGFGGYPIEDGQLVDSFFELVSLLPAGTVLHGLGVGTPESVVAGWEAGYTVFDCTLPTRNARRGVLYTALSTGDGSTPVGYRIARMGDDGWIRRSEPIDADCDCLTCTSHDASYLAHLFRIEDPSALAFFTQHNLRFYARLMERLRSPSGPGPGARSC